MPHHTKTDKCVGYSPPLTQTPCAVRKRVNTVMAGGDVNKARKYNYKAKTKAKISK